MSMNNTPSGDRIHIGFFGRRNAGKSSVVNAVTGQDLAVVSDVKGTTTDPVSKAMELLPLGPVMIIDTPGFDDEGELGLLRVKKTRQVLNKTDIAILVVDASEGQKDCDKQLIDLFKAKEINYIVVYNKSDLLDHVPADTDHEIYVSALKGEKIHELKERMARLQQRGTENRIVADKLSPGDFAVLVVPIDKAAPKGRLILPQQQTIRDILDAGCTVVTCRDEELPQTLHCLKAPPKLVITDSQVFGKVVKMLPAGQPLTSFSILFARYKGELSELVQGAAHLSRLRDGDKILISEGCTHHRQCGDIGTVKMPAWIGKFSNARITFDFTSGGTFPEDLSPYALVVHCGGCMLNEKEMKHRIRTAVAAGIPIVNYGVAIAHMNGILRRSLEVFPQILAELEE